MFGFLIKKNFFDLWDNLFASCFSNMSITILFFLYLLGLNRFTSTTAYPLILMTGVLVLLLGLMLLGSHGVINSWINYKRISWFHSFFDAIKNHRMHLLLFFLLIAFLIGCIAIFIPFYFSLDSYVGYLFAGILILAVIVLINSLMYYFPLTLIRDANPIQILKLSIGLFMDNKVFTVSLLIHNLVSFGISSITFFLFPSYLGIACANAIAVKLLLLRYAYMKEQGIANRKDIDLSDMLKEENSRVGERTLRNTIFPWKDR